MTKVINHNILGELYYNNGWYKEIKLSLFGKLQKMGLIIEGDEDAQFENSQIEAYKEFMKNKDILLKKCEEESYEYYQNVCLDYRDRLGNEFKDKLAPIVSNQDRLNNLVDPKQILFPMTFGSDIREFGILCECTWEEEHGLAIKYQDEKVVEVGYQDIII